MYKRGWTSFSLWALAGGLLSFAILAITSIGLYLLPIAVVTVVIIAQRGALWPDIMGFLEGVAATILWGTVISWGVPPCREGPLGTYVTVIRGCANIDSHRWLAAGLTLGLGGFVAYVWARARTVGPE